MIIVSHCAERRFQCSWNESDIHRLGHALKFWKLTAIDWHSLICCTIDQYPWVKMVPSGSSEETSVDDDCLVEWSTWYKSVFLQ